MMTTLRTSIRTAAIVGIGVAIARAARRHRRGSEASRGGGESPRPVPVQRVAPAPVSHELDFDEGATARPMGNDPGRVPAPADRVASAPVDRTGLGGAADVRVYGPGTTDAGVLYGEAGVATGDRDDDGTPSIQRFDGDGGETWMEALRSGATELGPRSMTSLDRVAEARAPSPSTLDAELDRDEVLDDLAPEVPPAPEGETPVADRGSGGPSGL